MVERGSAIERLAEVLAALELPAEWELLGVEPPQAAEGARFPAQNRRLVRVGLQLRLRGAHPQEQPRLLQWPVWPCERCGLFCTSEWGFTDHLESHEAEELHLAELAWAQETEAEPEPTLAAGPAAAPAPPHEDEVPPCRPGG